MENANIHGLLAPADCALALIDYQPAMFSGVHSHDRTTIVQNVQILAKAARLLGLTRPRLGRRMVQLGLIEENEKEH